MSATQLLATHRHGPRPGNSVPGTSTPPASNSGTSTVAPAPPVTAGPTRSVTPAGPVVQLGGAALHLPLGWVARDYRGYLTKGVSTLEAQAWCLTPADRPVSTAQFSCPVDSAPSRTRRPATRSMWTSGRLPERSGVLLPRGRQLESVRSADVTFGGRRADFRRFDHRCADGKRWRIEQYMVASSPGYILYSQTVDNEISAVMAQLVASATLPAQTSAVRYYDHGYVRSIVPDAGGVRISIDRVEPGPGGLVNNNPRTYDYFVPQSAKPAGLRVGELSRCSPTEAR